MLKIISLGNELRSDDGIGPRIIEHIKDIKHPIPITFINAGADAFILLEHLVDSEPIILVDCARMGKEPGSVEKFKIGEANLKQANEMVSLHGFSLAEIVQLARNVGEIAPCTILGIEPETTELGEQLSEKVLESIPRVINLVSEEIEKYAKAQNINH
jgi:hydrogenase maturation protease